MVAIASISLLVGGNRHHETSCSPAILERYPGENRRPPLPSGARRMDIIRQFVIEGRSHLVRGWFDWRNFGFVMSQLIAWLAGWSTVGHHRLHPSRILRFDIRRFDFRNLSSR